MTKFVKGALALQFAIAGVALAQNNDQGAQRSDQTVTHNDGLGGLLTSTDTKAPAGTIRASKLIGTEVYNNAGKHLGEIKDIVLDKDTRHIGYAVLSYGGIAGLGDKLFAMPRNMIQYNAADSRAMVSLDENVLKNAPGFDQSKWPTEANADYYQKLDTYYKDKGEHRADVAHDDLDRSARTAGEHLDRAADKTADAMKDAGNEVKDAGKDMAHETDAKLSKDHDIMAQPAGDRVVSNEPLTWNRRVSSVIGANVENAQGDNLGEVNDLVLDWGKGEVRYAVLSYGGVLGLGDKLFAVPMDSFQHSQDDSKLVLNVSKDQLKNAPGFNRDQWPNMADPQWTNQVHDFYHQDRTGADRAD